MAPPRGGPVFVCPQVRGDAQHAWRTLKPWRWKTEHRRREPVSASTAQLEPGRVYLLIRPTRTR